MRETDRERRQTTRELFGVERALIGCLHVAALPGTPRALRAVAEAVSIPVLVGSGITPENIAAYPEADAFIVGTALKREGRWTNPVDPSRAAALRLAFDALAAR